MFTQGLILLKLPLSGNTRPSILPEKQQQPGGPRVMALTHFAVVERVASSPPPKKRTGQSTEFFFLYLAKYRV